MTLDEALSAAVDGYRVRAVDMQPGAYIDYHFNGWRKNFPGGSSSAWGPRPVDNEVEWEVLPDRPPKRDAWGQLPKGDRTRQAIREAIGPNVNNDFGKWGKLSQPVDKWGRKA